MILMFLFLHLFSWNTHAQNTSFHLIDPSPSCMGTTARFKIENVWDFFQNYNNNGYEKYIQLTAIGPAQPVHAQMLLVDDLVNNNSDEVIVGFTIMPTDWFNPEDANVTIKGYQKVADTFVNIVTASWWLPVKNKFPNLSGSEVIVDPGPIVYSIDGISPLDAGDLSYVWSIPNSWSMATSENNGTEVGLMPGQSGGQVKVETFPEIDACNYPQHINVTIGDCAGLGQTQHPYCELEVWSDQYDTKTPDNTILDINKYPRMIGDFNGDGKDDLIKFDHDHVAVGISTGSSFNTWPWSSDFTYGIDGATQEKYPRMIGDFNGDGKDDIIGFGHDNTHVGISTGTSFNTSLFSVYDALSYSDGYTDRNVVQRLIGDFNGDGKDDVVAFGHNGHDVAISTGTSFDANLWNGNAEFSANGGWNDYNKYTKLVGDFNGDGKDDIVGFHNDGTYVGTSTGTSFVTWSWTNAFSVNDGMEQRKYPRMVGDFNGDGMDDIIGFGHNTITVGISNGMGGFDVSTWLDEKGFTLANGWRVDAREIGYVSMDDYGDAFDHLGVVAKSTRSTIRIGDANADGMDDIIGFGYRGLYISYSSGTSFLCPDLEQVLGNRHPVPGVTGYVYFEMLREIGNFDNTDPQLEFIGLNLDNVEVMNCDECDGASTADASLPNHSGVSQETGYQSWTVNVHKHCAGDVLLDLTQTTCEDRYKVEVHEFNLNDWIIENTVYSSGWVLGNTPDQINLSNEVVFQPNKLYMISVDVGPEWISKNLWMRLGDPDSDLYLSPDYSKVEQTKALQLYTVNEFCDTRLSFDAKGSFSSCYDEYRFEVTEVSTSTLNPIGGAVVNVPLGGGWTNGVSMPTNIPIPMNNLVQDKLYRIRLYTKNSAGEDYVTKYVRKIKCLNDQRKSIQFNEVSDVTTKSIVFPNPSKDGLIQVELTGHEGEDASMEILDMNGRIVHRGELSSYEKNEVDLSKILPGTYTIRISSDVRIESIKFVKK